MRNLHVIQTCLSSVTAIVLEMVIVKPLAKSYNKRQGTSSSFPLSGAFVGRAAGGNWARLCRSFDRHSSTCRPLTASLVLAAETRPDCCSCCWTIGKNKTMQTCAACAQRAQRAQRRIPLVEALLGARDAVLISACPRSLGPQGATD